MMTSTTAQNMQKYRRGIRSDLAELKAAVQQLDEILSALVAYTATSPTVDHLKETRTDAR